MRTLFISMCSLAVFGIGGAPSAAGTIVRFDTEFGVFDVELFDEVVPTTVENFLNYVTSGRYKNTLVHRSTNLSDHGIGVIQGGRFDVDLAPIPTDAPIALDYQLDNARGTLSAVRTNVQDSATSEWFINTTDNSQTLGPSNNGGFTVFGQVLGNGMDVVDAIDAIPTFNNELFSWDVPLHDFTPGVDDPINHTVVVNDISVVPEPSTGALAAGGAIIAAMLLRRRRPREQYAREFDGRTTYSARAGRR